MSEKISVIVLTFLKIKAVLCDKENVLKIIIIQVCLFIYLFA